MNLDLFTAAAPPKQGKLSRQGGARRRVVIDVQHDSTVRQLRPPKDVRYERENAFID
jgi:hypothetical protein